MIGFLCIIVYSKMDIYVILNYIWIYSDTVLFSFTSLTPPIAGEIAYFYGRCLLRRLFLCLDGIVWV